MHRRLTQSLLNLGLCVCVCVCVCVCDIAENMVGQNLNINYVHTRQNSKPELNTKRHKIPFATHNQNNIMPLLNTHIDPTRLYADT